MIILDATTKSLQVLLGVVVTTNELPIVAAFVDITPTTYGPGASDGQTNGTTAVAAVAAPAASTQRQLKFLTVFNADTVSATVTVRLNNNGTTRVLVAIALGVGSTLVYTDGEGFRVISNAGVIQ